MTLNGVMALTLRYFTEFGKPAFQHITASARIELIDQIVSTVCRRRVRVYSHGTPLPDVFRAIIQL